MSIEAVVVSKTNGEVSFRAELINDPLIGPGDLLIEPSFIGVCGSDLELLAGHFDSKMPVDYPVILGHEWSGTVVGVGGEVEGLSVGQVVIGHGVLGPDQWFGLTGFRGAMADRFIVDAGVCLAVPDSVSPQRAAMIEPTACAVEGIRKAGGVDAGTTAVVFGCGTLGLALIGVLASTGAAVVGIDPSERRRGLATQVGAIAAVPAGSGVELRAQLQERFGWDGVDFIAEGSGNSRAQAATFELTTRRSRILFMGLNHADADGVPLRYIHERDLRIFTSNGAEPSTWGPTLALVDRSGLDLTPAVSHVFEFSQIEEAIAAARSPESAGKVMLRPSALPVQR